MKTGIFDTILPGKLAGCSATPSSCNCVRHQVRRANEVLSHDSLKSPLVFVLFSYFLTLGAELDIESSSRWKAVTQGPV